jgi:hypothetical protein
MDQETPSSASKEEEAGGKEPAGPAARSFKKPARRARIVSVRQAAAAPPPPPPDQEKAAVVGAKRKEPASAIDRPIGPYEQSIINERREQAEFLQMTMDKACEAVRKIPFRVPEQRNLHSHDLLMRVFQGAEPEVTDAVFEYVRKVKDVVLPMDSEKKAVDARIADPDTNPAVRAMIKHACIIDALATMNVEPFIVQFESRCDPERYRPFMGNLWAYYSASIAGANINDGSTGRVKNAVPTFGYSIHEATAMFRACYVSGGKMILPLSDFVLQAKRQRR